MKLKLSEFEKIEWQRKRRRAVAWVIVTTPIWGTGIVDVLFWRAWSPLPQVATAIAGISVFGILFRTALEELL
jgi:hypothetical protein